MGEDSPDQTESAWVGQIEGEISTIEDSSDDLKKELETTKGRITDPIKLTRMF